MNHNKNGSSPIQNGQQIAENNIKIETRVVKLSLARSSEQQ